MPLIVSTIFVPVLIALGPVVPSPSPPLEARSARALPGMVDRQPGAQDDPAVVRRELTAVNKAWSAARIAYDSAAYERMLTSDFYVLLGGQRLTRAEFIRRVSQRLNGVRLVRFDNPLLTLTKGPTKDEWVAVVLEKLEYERAKADGTGSEKAYALWITRDGYRRVGTRWQLTYSEAIGSETWSGGTTPPFPDW
ncbi:MAG TPA: hypothetical protein VFZ21_30420 [Gemmatimonadaceae bacterium]|nr:hypothetical protein [Gemmatimonadaceae bacterium]